jgi:hypothetical protein
MCPHVNSRTIESSDARWLHCAHTGGSRGKRAGAGAGALADAAAAEAPSTPPSLASSPYMSCSICHSSASASSSM